LGLTSVVATAVVNIGADATSVACAEFRSQHVGPQASISTAVSNRPTLGRK
jgi:hypothetical protein